MSDTDILEADYHRELPAATINTDTPPHQPLRALKPYTSDLHALLTIVETHHDALSCAEAEICQSIDSLRNTLNTLFDEENKGERKIDVNLQVACEAKFEVLEASFRAAFRQMLKFEEEREGACRGAVLWDLEKAVEVEHKVVWVLVREMEDLVREARAGESSGCGDLGRTRTKEEE